MMQPGTVFVVAVLVACGSQSVLSAPVLPVTRSADSIIFGPAWCGPSQDADAAQLGAGDVAGRNGQAERQNGLA